MAAESKCEPLRLATAVPSLEAALRRESPNFQVSVIETRTNVSVESVEEG